MVFDESGSDSNHGAAEEDVAGAAYREALTSADGFTRGPGGRIKFNKDTKKRRRENAAEDEDVEMGEAESGKAGKKRGEAKIGHEFRAKVRMLSSTFLVITPICCHSGRRPVVISKSKEGSTLMHTFPWDRRPRRETDGMVLDWQENDELSSDLQDVKSRKDVKAKWETLSDLVAHVLYLNTCKGDRSRTIYHGLKQNSIVRLFGVDQSSYNDTT